MAARSGAAFVVVQAEGPFEPAVVQLDRARQPRQARELFSVLFVPYASSARTGSASTSQPAARVARSVAGAGLIWNPTVSGIFPSVPEYWRATPGDILPSEPVRSITHATGSIRP